MPLPDAVRRVASLVPGARVKVIMQSGAVYALPLAPEQNQLCRRAR